METLPLVKVGTELISAVKTLTGSVNMLNKALEGLRDDEAEKAGSEIPEVGVPDVFDLINEIDGMVTLAAAGELPEEAVDRAESAIKRLKAAMETLISDGCDDREEIGRLTAENVSLKSENTALKAAILGK